MVEHTRFMNNPILNILVNIQANRATKFWYGKFSIVIIKVGNK